jgi:hypothetical protein
MNAALIKENTKVIVVENSATAIVLEEIPRTMNGVANATSTPGSKCPAQPTTNDKKEQW